MIDPLIKSIRVENDKLQALLWINNVLESALGDSVKKEHVVIYIMMHNLSNTRLFSEYISNTIPNINITILHICLDSN